MAVSSGYFVNVARAVLDDSFLAAESISGGKFVTFGSGSAGLIECRASPGGNQGAAARLPGIGRISDTALSGLNASVTFLGRTPFFKIAQIADAFLWSRHLYIGASGFITQPSDTIGTGSLEDTGGIKSGGHPNADQVPVFALNARDLLVAKQNQRILSQTASGLLVVHRFETVPVRIGTGMRNQSLLNTPTAPFAALACSGIQGMRVAMASVSGLMPAHAVCIEMSSTSGALGYYVSRWVGLIARVSGRAPGSRLYVGRSGEVCTISGDVMSGGFLSGNIVQPVGVVIGSGGMSLINVRPITFSGYVEPYT